MFVLFICHDIHKDLSHVPAESPWQIDREEVRAAFYVCCVMETLVSSTNMEK